MNKTSIEWVKNPDGAQGYTWNPITGCLNHDNGLCKGGGFPCYAYKIANGRLKQGYLANKNIADQCFDYRSHTPSPFNDSFYPRFWEDRLDDSLFITKSLRTRLEPRGIFVCDMGELFGDWIPHAWQEEVFLTIINNPQHRFYPLTKQPQNLIKFSPFPENCYVGVTATNTSMFMVALDYLNRINATIKFISLEPLLGWNWGGRIEKPSNALRDINWLIIGSCTGTYLEMLDLHHRLNGFIPATGLKRLDDKGKYSLQPRIEWVEEIVEAADKAGIKVFLKNNLKPLLAIQGIQDNRFWADKRDEDSFEDLHLELRQEIP